MELITELLLNAGGTVTAGAVVVAILSLLQISKIKINPWTAIRKWIGATFGKEYGERIFALDTRLKVIEELLTRHIEDSDRRDADRARRRILAFERELQWDVRHSGEEFQDVLETVRQYETYCTEHPQYHNHVADYAAAHIKETYQERLRKHDFLKEEKP